MATDHRRRPQAGAHDDAHAKGQTGTYLLAATILTAMVVRIALTFVSSYEWGHVRSSESRIYVPLTLGGTMGLIMLAWMLIAATREEAEARQVPEFERPAERGCSAS